MKSQGWVHALFKSQPLGELHPKYLNPYFKLVSLREMVVTVGWASNPRTLSR